MPAWLPAPGGEDLAALSTHGIPDLSRRAGVEPTRLPMEMCGELCQRSKVRLRGLPFETRSKEAGALSPRFIGASLLRYEPDAAAGREDAEVEL